MNYIRLFIPNSYVFITVCAKNRRKILIENIKDYPKIIGIIKKHFTQTSGIEYSIKNNREADIWQRRYYEHTIRDEEDLYRHIDYIHYNPVKHGLALSPKDWKFSSFMKFVKLGFYDIDWCNFNDKYNINTINIE